MHLCVIACRPMYLCICIIDNSNFDSLINIET